jgi:hypothetical protein
MISPRIARYIERYGATVLIRPVTGTSKFEAEIHARGAGSFTGIGGSVAEAITKLEQALNRDEGGEK